MSGEVFLLLCFWLESAEQLLTTAYDHFGVKLTKHVLNIKGITFTLWRGTLFWHVARVKPQTRSYLKNIFSKFYLGQVEGDRFNGLKKGNQLLKT